MNCSDSLSHRIWNANTARVSQIYDDNDNQMDNLYGGMLNRLNKIVQEYICDVDHSRIALHTQGVDCNMID